MIIPLVSWNFSYEMVNFVYMNNYQKPIFEGGIVSRGGWLKVVNLWERRTDWELKISEKRRTSCEKGGHVSPCPPACMPFHTIIRL
jgi:hypothetical protein